jgi:hypothetical protein
MTEPETDATPGPYATAAPTYWAAGWRGILPLPANAKTPVPRGYTGTGGTWPSYPDVQAWTEDRGHGNIALRLPPDVLGVDVDHYGNKPGGAVLASLEEQLGTLPPTWRTTSRDDGVSGIRLYRIPAGLRWPGVLGPGIETIRHEHRYAVTWPSIHPAGGTYRWITPDGATALGVVPSIDDLPDLPDAWIQHFTHGELATDQAHADLSRSAAHQWVTDRDSGALPPCRHMGRALRRGLDDLTGATSRHDTMLSLTNRIVWLAGEGHVGSPDALDQARRAFLAAVAGDRDPAEAAAEFDRMVTGAVRIAAAAHPTPSTDPCDDPFAGLIAKDTTWPISTPPTSPTTSDRRGPTVTTPTATATPAPAAAPSSTTPPVAGSPAPSPDADTGSATDEVDDLTELQIRRNQAAAQEVERLRAQRAAQRLLEQEDEEQAIADRVRRRILDDKAAQAYREATEPPSPGFDLGTLAEVLERPADPPMRIDGLLPWTGSGLVVAQRKTGKTTLLLNYARCLLTGEPFLGEFDVIALPPDARVAFLNYEVSAAQLARWADEVGVPRDRLVLVNLRGRRNPLGRPDDRAELAAILREKNVQSVIVDPFGRAYTGISQNDNGEVQAFLVGLEEFVRSEVGALDLLLATHAGWDGERTRGASALEDWGDTIITLTRDAEDDSKRFMKAMGRDVDVDEDELVMDPLTRVLSRTGNGSRRNQRGDAESSRLAVYVIRAARENPGCSKSKMAAAIKEMYDAPSLAGGRGDQRLSKAIRFAESNGRIRVEKGAPGQPNRHYEATTSTTSAPPPGNYPQTTSTPVGTEGVGGGGRSDGTSQPSSGGGRAHGKQTPIAGGKYVYDHNSGLTLDAHTGEVAETGGAS